MGTGDLQALLGRGPLQETPCYKIGGGAGKRRVEEEVEEWIKEVRGRRRGEVGEKKKELGWMWGEVGEKKKEVGWKLGEVGERRRGEVGGDRVLHGSL